MSGRKILVAYGSRNGGTAGIAGMIGQVLRDNGYEVDVYDAASVRDVGDYSAVVVGGALYTSRWHRDATRFVRRHRRDLAARPVWLFSSGPLDHSADEREIPPVPTAGRAARLVGARQHQTFGGRLDEQAKGWIARRMVAGGKGGDFRDQERIHEWAEGIAASLSEAGAASPAEPG